MNIITHYSDWLNLNEWHAHLPIRFYGLSPPDWERQIITDVLRPLELLTAQKIAALGVILPPEYEIQQHAHFLIRFTKSVPDLDQLEQQLFDRRPKRSKIVTHRDAVWIIPINENSVPYVAKNLLECPAATIHHYREKLYKGVTPCVTKP